MRRVLRCAVGFVALLIPASAFAIAIDPTPLWTVSPSGFNCYYLNNNLDGASVLVGQIGFGARQYDTAGNELESLSLMGGLLPTENGAKCLLRLGDYYYVTDGNAGGIARFDAKEPNRWTVGSLQSAINPGGTGPEAIVTDGTYIYANDDGAKNRIHAYSVSTTPFGLTEAWSVDLSGGGRVRGLTYDPDSGYLYMHNGGDGSSTSFYAVDTATQTVYEVGTHTEGGTAYQALRYGDELLVFGTSDNMTAYSLTDDTTLGAMTSQTGLGLGDIYGAAIYDDILFIASAGGKLSGFQIVPEPGSMLLLILGSVWLLFRPRRHHR